jgi:hypothetical protein
MYPDAVYVGELDFVYVAYYVDCWAPPGAPVDEYVSPHVSPRRFYIRLCGVWLVEEVVV